MTEISRLAESPNLTAIVEYCFPSQIIYHWINDDIPDMEVARSSVARFFDVPIVNVIVVGSAKFGFSPLTLEPFRLGLSDLDLAIVDESAYLRYSYFARMSSHGGEHPLNGLIRPDRYPDRAEFTEWIGALKKISNENRENFSEITVSVYKDTAHLKRGQTEAVLAMRSMICARRKGLTVHEPMPESCTAIEFLKKISAEYVDLSRAYPQNSSPFQMSLATLMGQLESGYRFNMLKNMCITLESLPSGLVAHALLIGGSFVDSKISNPKDLDCVLYYSLENGANINNDLENVSIVRASWHLLNFANIDCRLVPLDAGPLLIIKMTSFMSGLYAAERGGGASRKALLLIDLNGFQSDLLN